MPDPFDGYQYLAHLRARWRLPAVMVVTALAVALGVSLLLPKKYTATATLLIEPPAGSDPRVSTAVSPIYLESLRSYEYFASSDQLFAQAAERFGLRSGASHRPLEGLKTTVLKVSIPRNTRILEISATLTDAAKAHALARYIAEETIKLNRTTNRAADEELVADRRKQLEEASARWDRAQAARDRAIRRSPTPEALRADLVRVQGIREEIGRLLLTAAGSRGESLQKRAGELDREVGSKQELLAQRVAEIDIANAEYDAAWTAREEAEKRIREIEAAAGFRGERLSLIDPGISPEQPSSPKILLNLLVAAALALVASLVWLTLEFGLGQQRAESLRASFRIATKG